MTRVVAGHEIAMVYMSTHRTLSGSEATTTTPPVRGTVGGNGRWQIRQRHTVGDSAVTNAAVLDDLAGGVGAIEVLLDDSSQLAEVLNDVDLSIAPIGFTSNPNGNNAWALIDLWSSWGIADADASGCFGLDPLGAGASLDPAAQAAMASAATISAERFANVRSVSVDTSGYANRGGSPASELGLSMATAAEYLRALHDAGIDIDQAASEIEFTYLATADQFVTIAKLRAARWLWHRVVDVCAGSASAAVQQQRAITASPVSGDPWLHVLGSTTACFAAAAGGAQAITVVPFESDPTEYDDAFAARIARNTQHLLLDEAHVGEVVDPGGGSPYIETLTRTLATEGWAVFGSIEAEGGLAAVAEAGGIDDLVAP